MDHEFRPAASRWRPVRRWAVAAYIGAFAVSAFVAGVPLSRVTAVAWTLGAFAVYSIGRGWRLLGRALGDWLPFTAVMVCYDLTRGVADELGREVHVSWPVAADRWMFGGAVPTVWLQQRFHTPNVVHWYHVLASVTYLSYFFVVPLTMAVMWIRNRTVWRRFTANVVALSFAALATYVVSPEAPPWYASSHGLMGELGLRTAGDLIEEGQATANAVAAMPSLHFGYAMLVAVFFRKRVSRRVRPLLLAYPRRWPSRWSTPVSTTSSTSWPASSMSWWSRAPSTPPHRWSPGCGRVDRGSGSSDRTTWSPRIRRLYP
jgi:hypothetical protein